MKGESFKSKIFSLPPTFADIIWNRLHVLPIEFFIGKVDVFHSSDWTQPPSKAFKVTTIHDLVPLKFPELSHRKIVSAHQVRLKRVKKEIDRVITPSNSTKKDLIDIGIDKGKIRVIAEAPDSIFRPVNKEEIEKVKRKYQIEGNYLMSVGVNQRKNTQRIINAFKKVRVNLDLILVIVGHPYIDIEKVEGVRVLGQVPFEELPTLYSGADALVYPSLYEGFGLPILEAFVCKTPVVTSNLGSLKEVAGKAAVLVDPHSVDSVAEGVRKALSARKLLVKKGLARVKDFSWQKTAKETLKVYQEAER